MKVLEFDVHATYNWPWKNNGFSTRCNVLSRGRWTMIREKDWLSLTTASICTPTCSYWGVRFVWLPKSSSGSFFKVLLVVNIIMFVVQIYLVCIFIKIYLLKPLDKLAVTLYLYLSVSHKTHMHKSWLFLLEIVSQFYVNSCTVNFGANPGITYLPVHFNYKKRKGS